MKKLILFTLFCNYFMAIVNAQISCTTDANCPPVPNATIGCVANVCRIISCASGFVDCNGIYTDGCEVDLLTNPTNCGSCGHICPTPPHATATCVAAACSFTCNTGWADCDGNRSNGCEKAIPVITAPNSVCIGATATLTASGGTTYLWNTGATTATINVIPIQTSVYSVAIDGCNAASTSATVTLNSLPSAGITGTAIGCNSVNLTATGGVSYVWSGGGSVNSATNTFTSSNNYSVTVTDSNNCSASASKSVTVNPSPNNGVNVTGNTTFCSGDSVTLTAQGTGTYNWSNGSTNPSITVNQIGSYNVTITDANNCTAASNPINITVIQNPTTPTITADGPTAFCLGGSVTLTASGMGNYFYQWDNGGVVAIGYGPSITVSENKNFTITVINGTYPFFCRASSTQVVTVYPLPNVSITSLPSFINITSSALNLLGIPSGGSFSGIGVSNNSFNPSVAGLGLKTVLYSYTDGNGCSNTTSASTIIYDTTGIVCTSYDTTHVAISDTSHISVYDTTHVSVSTTDTLLITVNLTGIAPPNNTNNLQVYPNPTHDHLLINCGNYATMNGYSIKITNTLGQIVFNQPVNQQQFYIDVSTWGGAGTYILYVLDAQQAVKNIKEVVLQ